MKMNVYKTSSLDIFYWNSFSHNEKLSPETNAGASKQKFMTKVFGQPLPYITHPTQQYSDIVKEKTYDCFVMYNYAEC